MFLVTALESLETAAFRLGGTRPAGPVFFSTTCHYWRHPRGREKASNRQDIVPKRLARELQFGLETGRVDIRKRVRINA